MKKNKKIFLLATVGIFAAPAFATAFISAHYNDPLVTGTFDISEAQDNSLIATITQTGNDYFVEVTGKGKINKSKWKELFFDSVWNSRNAARNVKRVNINKGVLFPDDSSDLFKTFVFAEINIYKGIKTSNITNMKSMFTNCQVANPDVEDWNVSNVTNFESMFLNAFEATPQVGKWDTHSATNMKEMFAGTKKANPDVSNWNVSNVTNFDTMFGYTELADPQVGKWDTHSATNMSGMFASTQKANPDVSNWDVSNVKDFDTMFQWTIVADPDVSNWDVSSATNISYMFRYSEKADPDVSNWDVSNVTNFTEAFGWPRKANPDVSKWKINDNAKLSGIFWGVTNGHVDITKLDLSKFKNADAFRTPLSLRMTGAQLKKIYSRNQELALITTTNNGIYIDGDNESLVKGFDGKVLKKEVVDSVNIEDDTIYIIKPQNYNKHLNVAQKDNVKNKILKRGSYNEEIDAAIKKARLLDKEMERLDKNKKTILKKFIENKNETSFYESFNNLIDEIENKSSFILNLDNDSEDANKDFNYVNKENELIENLIKKYQNTTRTYLFSDEFPDLNYDQQYAIWKKIEQNNNVGDINEIVKEAKVLDEATKSLKNTEGILDEFANSADPDVQKVNQKVSKLQNEFQKIVKTKYDAAYGHETDEEINALTAEIKKLLRDYKDNINNYIDSLPNLNDQEKVILKDKVNNENSIADIKDIKDVATKADSIKPLLNEFINDKKSDDSFKDFNKELDDWSKEIEDILINEYNKSNDELYQLIDDLNDKINSTVLNDYKDSTNNYINSLKYLNKAQKGALKIQVNTATNKQEIDEVFVNANVLNDSMKKLTETNSEILQEYIKDLNKYSNEFKKEVQDLNEVVSQTLDLNSKTANTTNEEVQNHIKAINDLINSYKKEAKRFIDTLEEFSNLNKAQKDTLKNEIDSSTTDTPAKINDILGKAKNLDEAMKSLAKANEDTLEDFVTNKDKLPTRLKTEVENLNKKVQKVIDKNNANLEADKTIGEVQNLIDKINNLINEAKTEAKTDIDALENLNPVQAKNLGDKIETLSSVAKIVKTVDDAIDLDNKMKNLNDMKNNKLDDFVTNKDRLPKTVANEIEDLNNEVNKILESKNSEDTQANKNSIEVQKLIDRISNLLKDIKEQANEFVDNLDNLNQAQKDALKTQIYGSNTGKQIGDILEFAKQLDFKMNQLSEATNTDLENVINSKLATKTKKQKATELMAEIETFKDTTNLSINNIDEYIKHISDIKNLPDIEYIIKLKNSIEVQDMLANEITKDDFVTSPELNEGQKLVINSITFDDKEGTLKVIYSITNTPKNNASKMFTGFKKYVEPAPEKDPLPNIIVNPISDEVNDKKPETNNDPKEKTTTDTEPIKKLNSFIPDNKKLKAVKKEGFKAEKIYQELLIANLTGVILSLGILLLVIKRYKKHE